MLPYFLGCPSWSEAAWRGSLYPADMPATASLATYCRVFNAVEGNTTFYARPAPATLARWAEQMPAHFHFCAKLPREISHSASLFEQGAALADFLHGQAACLVKTRAPQPFVQPHGLMFAHR